MATIYGNMQTGSGSVNQPGYAPRNGNMQVENNGNNNGNGNKNTIPWLGSFEYNLTSGLSPLNQTNITVRNALIPYPYIKLEIFKTFLENCIRYLPQDQQIQALTNLSGYVHYRTSGINPFRVEKKRRLAEKMRNKALAVKGGVRKPEPKMRKKVAAK